MQVRRFRISKVIFFPFFYFSFQSSASVFLMSIKSSTECRDAIGSSLALMPGKERVNVVWFKCTDLRCHDHAALKAAHQGPLPVLHVYVFDPFWNAGRTRLCGFPKTGAIRNRFQIEAVQDLAERLREKGQVLNVRSQLSTKQCFEELCQDRGIYTEYFWRWIPFSEKYHCWLFIFCCRVTLIGIRMDKVSTKQYFIEGSLASQISMKFALFWAARGSRKV